MAHEPDIDPLGGHSGAEFSRNDRGWDRWGARYQSSALVSAGGAIAILVLLVGAIALFVGGANRDRDRTIDALVAATTLAADLQSVDQTLTSDLQWREAVADARDLLTDTWVLPGADVHGRYWVIGLDERGNIAPTCATVTDDGRLVVVRHQKVLQLGDERQDEGSATPADWQDVRVQVHADDGCRSLRRLSLPPGRG